MKHTTSFSDRRRFLQQVGMASAVFGFSGRLSGAAAGAPTVAAQKNRAPLAPNAFYALPLGSVRPRGWLKKQLQIQASGLSGHLDETWADVGPNSGWLGGTGESWERGPYFLDGLVPLAYLLGDKALQAKAQRYIDWTLTHQDASGMLGPASNNDWWPRFVMLKVLTQYQEATEDARVVPALERYFAYQLRELPRRPLRDWGKFRWQDEALSVLWLYNRNGNPELLDLVRLLHAQGHDWIGQFREFPYTQRITADTLKLNEGNGLGDLALSTHGVNNGQAIKTGAVWSVLTGKVEDRGAVLHMMAELDRYHGLPNGMFSCDEHLAGRNPSQGSELCTVVEYMFSLEQALAIVGDAALGDRLEKLAFNALPGTLTDDMWAHQYNQQPNQVECSLHQAPWTTDGPESNLYGLEPNFGCCTANFHQGWPKFAAHLFMLSPDDGLAAVAYAPCEVSTMVRGTTVKVTEETEYPFRGTIEMRVTPEAPVRFPLTLRIPGWAARAHLRVNGQEQAAVQAGSFARIERIWKAGDRVTLELPLEARVSLGFNGSVAVERGPLVFSHNIGQDWVKLRDRGLTADWQVYPAAAWNYALAVDLDDAAKSFSVTENRLGERPFAAAPAAVTMKAKARKVPEWRSLDGVADPVPMSPVTSQEVEETIELVPYAAAKLRITAFPHWREG